MPGLLAHCLVAMALEGVLGRACGFPNLSWGMFAAGIIAILIDLDDCAIPPGRTPLGHSFLSALCATYMITAAAAIVSPAGAAETALAVIAAFGSHLGLDMCTRGGIFLIPRTRRIADWLEALPERSLRFDGAEYVPLDEPGLVELNEGTHSWKAWRRACIASSIEDGSGRQNTALCMAGLVGIILLVVVA